VTRPSAEPRSECTTSPVFTGTSASARELIVSFSQKDAIWSLETSSSLSPV
jgi:hypothetical protein